MPHVASIRPRLFFSTNGKTAKVKHVHRSLRLIVCVLYLLSCLFVCFLPRFCLEFYLDFCLECYLDFTLIIALMFV